ncbi:hypothetical protein BH11PSE2_BH11PSE2_09610 [soil metagenome]
MAESQSFFEKMLHAVLADPADAEADTLRARVVLNSAGSDAVEAAIAQGDAFASALWLLAQGETRAQLAARVEAANPPN